ncbi:MAG: flagellar hook assembly protein FlgD [Armatimonadota bacterium]
MMVVRVEPSAILDTPTSPMDQIGGDDFLAIMAAELSHQDPMKPMSHSEFLGQLAQLRTASASISMDASVAALAQVQQVGHALSLMGQTVWWADAKSGRLMRGKVTRVEPAFPPLLYAGDTRLRLEDILAVGAAAPGQRR